jgi:hypothetical protein
MMMGSPGGGAKRDIFIYLLLDGWMDYLPSGVKLNYRLRKANILLMIK